MFVSALPGDSSPRSHSSQAWTILAKSASGRSKVEDMLGSLRPPFGTRSAGQCSRNSPRASTDLFWSVAHLRTGIFAGGTSSRARSRVVRVHHHHRQHDEAAQLRDTCSEIETRERRGNHTKDDHDDVQDSVHPAPDEPESSQGAVDDGSIENDEATENCRNFGSRALKSGADQGCADHVLGELVKPKGALHGTGHSGRLRHAARRTFRIPRRNECGPGTMSRGRNTTKCPTNRITSCRPYLPCRPCRPACRHRRQPSRACRRPGIPSSARALRWSRRSAGQLASPSPDR